MRLKSLEIKGFKSFADRTVINFGEDVIGIVGSNGCGKSNIVDAIRWVLGEQKTSQLRSSSMTSVIFNGTKGRKASGLAEVTLTFVNDKGILPVEYQEVSIRRALFKDGSSEYQLNGVKCRLKDISNLLVDTGMGSDSYAIIALGMVDDLLQDKENARLKLFEQAAGISKYKSRKKETFSKLKATEADLARVEDLLFEIKKNLKSLERQAKRAKRYFDLKEEYRRLSLELSYFKIDACKKQYKSLEVQLEKEQKRKAELEQQLAQQESKLEKRKAANEQVEQQLGESQKELQRLIGKIKGKENDKKMLQQKTLFLQQNNEQLDERMAQNRHKVKETTERIERYSDQLDEAHLLGRTLSADLQEAQQALEQIRSQHGATKKELEGFLGKQSKLSNAVFEQEKRLAILQNESKAAEQNLSRLKERLAERQKEVAVVAEQAAQLKATQSTQEKELETLKQLEQARQETLEEKTQALEAAKETLQQENRALDAKQNEYKLLKGLVENMEGFSASIKFLHQQKAWAEQAVLLSDIFYCQPDYRTAVENFLEPYLNYYVVADFAAAMQAIQLLDVQQKGKANFFILNQLPKKTNKGAELEGVAALELLEYDDKYEQLAQHLMGKVYLGEAPYTTAIPMGYTWLTKDGKLIQQGSQVRGGSVGAFEGKKIGRKKNLELLEKQIATLKTSTETLKTKVEGIQTECQSLRQANKQSSIQQLEKQLNQTVRQVITVQGKLDSFEQFKQDSEAQEQGHQAKLKACQGQEAEVQERLKQLQKQLAQLKTTVSEKDSAAQDIAAQLSETSAAYNKKHIEQVRHQNGMATIEKELDFCYRQLKEAKDQQKQDEQLLQEAGGSLETTQKDIEAATQQLEEWYDLRKKRQESVNESEKSYFEARAVVTDLEATLKEQQQQHRKNLELLSKLDQAFNQVKLELTAIAERLKVEFEVKINDLVNENPNPNFQESVLESNVSQLRKQLNNYGPINPMAIEAYEEIQQRNELIEAQQKDLVESKTNLLATIQEIEAKATERFMNSFNEVRGHFVQVFRSLFHKDDTCDLKLSDPEHPLESRIEIIARPKGKRPLSINQLSGGEKTLTATALLFSLYLLKPAPFCIFDEVDAPLDDANIAKFNNIIKDFSENSQFVIVTHNKKTMESVDIMYGVTMVRGISRVVPVDFRALQTVT